MRITIHQPNRGCIYQVDVSRYQLSKSWLRAGLDEACEQFLSCVHYHFTTKEPPTLKIRPKFHLFPFAASCKEHEEKIFHCIQLIPNQFGVFSLLCSFFR